MDEEPLFRVSTAQRVRALPFFIQLRAQWIVPGCALWSKKKLLMNKMHYTNRYTLYLFLVTMEKTKDAGRGAMDPWIDPPMYRPQDYGTAKQIETRNSWYPWCLDDQFFKKQQFDVAHLVR